MFPPEGLLEQSGNTHDSTLKDAVTSTEETGTDTGKKSSLGDKIKDKLHIGKH